MRYTLRKNTFNHNKVSAFRLCLAGALAFFMGGLSASDASAQTPPPAQISPAQSAPSAVAPPAATGGGGLTIDITRGQVQPLQIAIPMFAGQGAEVSNTSDTLTKVIRNDLQNSGLFLATDGSAVAQDSGTIMQSAPDYRLWQGAGTEALVTGTVVPDGSGRIKVDIKVWDVFASRELMTLAYTTTDSNSRRLAHVISDAIYKRIVGDDGYFDTRVVYISESGAYDKRVKRLAIMDQDGANHQYLTDGSFLVLTPRFSPTEQKIAYMAYLNNRPRVYIYDLTTGSQEELGSFPGMTFAPRFSPDGTKVVMSFAENGNSDIYTMDLASRSVTRLTRESGIDTAPSFSPDGRRIVFESDRGGKQQLYTMNADGSGVSRISFGSGRYANPVWSPRGDQIAFIKLEGGKFFIGLMRPDGSAERLITSARHVEGPSWASNGRVLMYFKETVTGGGTQRSAKMYFMDIVSFFEREVGTPQDGSDPAWSPKL